MYLVGSTYDQFSSGVILKINLSTMVVEMQNYINKNAPENQRTQLIFSVRGSYLDTECEDDACNNLKKVPRYYGYFFDVGGWLYKFDLKTLNVTDIAKKEYGGIVEVACTDGINRTQSNSGSIYFGTSTGKIITASLEKPSSGLASVVDVGSAVISMVCLGRDAGYFASIGLTNVRIASFGNGGANPPSLPLSSDMTFIYNPLAVPGALFYVSARKYSKDMKLIKLNIGKELFGQVVEIPYKDKPIGKIHDSKSPDFPPLRSKRPLHSLFLSNTTLVNGGQKIDYMYWTTSVHDFKDNRCATSQPDYLCKRINLASTELQIVESNKYSLYVLFTLFITAASSIFSGLSKFALYAPLIYNKLKSKCGRNKDAQSGVDTINPVYQLDDAAKNQDKEKRVLDHGDVELNGL